MTGSIPSPWQGRFFRRIFTRVGFLVSVGMVLVCILTWEITHQGMLASTQSQLAKAAELAEITLRQNWPYPDEAAISANCRMIRDRIALRVTVVDARGAVIGESDAQPAQMENHASRPEVAAALQGRVGYDRRTSASVRRPFHYVAVPLRIDGKVAAVVRIAAPVDDFQRREAALVRWVLVGLAVALPVALLIAFAMSRALAEPVRRMSVLAQRLSTGDMNTAVELDADDEIGQVAQSLERMRLTLSERIRQVQRQREDLEVTLAGLEEGVIAVNDQGVVLTVNNAARDLLGTRETLVGWPLTVGLRDATMTALWSEAVASGREEIRRVVELTSPGAVGRTVSVAVVRIRRPESPIAWLLCLRDITDLARSAAMKADFVANASHELRTPVAAILAAVETLSGNGLDGTVRERFMKVIARNAERLGNLIEDLMQLNRVESESAPIRVEPVTTDELFTQLKATFADCAREKRAALQFEDDSVSLYTDRRWLEIVLKNLIDNAVKFVAEGGTVIVRSRYDDQRARFEVQDDGCGIPPEDLDRVFERFYQVDKSRSLNVGGTGLGLAIVKHAVARLGGEIAIHSTLGRGTTVSFWLPLRRTPSSIPD